MSDLGSGIPIGFGAGFGSGIAVGTASGMRRAKEDMARCIREYAATGSITVKDREGRTIGIEEFIQEITKSSGCGFDNKRKIAVVVAIGLLAAGLLVFYLFYRSM